MAAAVAGGDAEAMASEGSHQGHPMTLDTVVLFLIWWVAILTIVVAYRHLVPRR